MRCVRRGLGMMSASGSKSGDGKLHLLQGSALAFV
jgi:hypothetical protein